MFSFDLDTNEMFIYDELGPAWWGLIDAASVMAGLKQMDGKHVTVRLNTPGGSVDEGIAMFNAFRAHKGGVTTIVDSLAASMGSYLLQAGEQRIVASNAMVMVHDPWTISIGNSAQMRKDADILDKYAQRMIPDYAKRSGKTEDEIKALMAAESWYAGQEIVDAGFADSVQDGAEVEPVVAGLRHIAKNVPERLVAKYQAAAGDRHQFPNRTAAIAAKKFMTVAEAKALAASVR